MASSTITEGQSALSGSRQGALIGGLGFDRVMALLCAWFVGGLFLDGWAHGHGLVDKTFFTPWHAVLYSGYAVCALALLVAIGLNRRRGASWSQAIPAGYLLSLMGAPLFLVAGVGDLIWHTLFGFEVGIEPLLSPTHLLLAFSGLLIMSGPLRATWGRSEPLGSNSWRTLLPALISLLAVFSVFTFFTNFAHPLVDYRLVSLASGNGNKSWGTASILLQAALLMGVSLFALRRWRLPFGAFTLLFTINAVLESVLPSHNQYWLMLCALLAGLVADLLNRNLRPAPSRLEALRLFAFVVPVVYYLGYFITLMLLGGITWSIHLWLGSSVMAGVVGLVLSYILLPPASPVVNN
jgi:hypothetical protein